MEKIQHSHVEVRGLKLHVAEIGTAHNVVLFLHGFPEIWYSWRHQMIAVANAGYRAIAIDFRGYRLSDQPSEPEKANFNDLVDDVVALLDSLGISKVFLVGKDFGAVPAFLLAVVHPDRVSGVITLGIPFLIPSPDGVQFDLLPKGFYVLRWAEPGRAEADFGRFDVKTVVRNIYILFSGSELQVAGEDQEIMDLVDPSTPLPPWFTEDDLDVYATLYKKSGFRTALQVPYRYPPSNNNCLQCSLQKEILETQSQLGRQFLFSDPKFGAYFPEKMNCHFSLKVNTLSTTKLSLYARYIRDQACLSSTTGAFNWIMV
ncbi:hypothetical protein CRYUN_Cryun10bG0069600 [Craigia yunnanensis]